MTAVDDHGFTLDWMNDGEEREFAYVALSRREVPGPAVRFVDRIARLARR